jgi:hypothetical protein
VPLILLYERENIMKTLKTIVAATVLATVAISASAQHRDHGYHGGGGYNGNALGIGLVIGALGSALIYQNQQPVYVTPPPVVYYPPPVVYAEPPPVIFLQDGTQLTYNYRTGLWVDIQGRAYKLPQ